MLTYINAFGPKCHILAINQPNKIVDIYTTIINTSCVLITYIVLITTDVMELNHDPFVNMLH